MDKPLHVPSADLPNANGGETNGTSHTNGTNGEQTVPRKEEKPTLIETAKAAAVEVTNGMRDIVVSNWSRKIARRFPILLHSTQQDYIILGTICGYSSAPWFGVQQHMTAFYFQQYACTSTSAILRVLSSIWRILVYIIYFLYRQKLVSAIHIRRHTSIWEASLQPDDHDERSRCGNLKSFKKHRCSGGYTKTEKWLMRYPTRSPQRRQSNCHSTLFFP